MASAQCAGWSFKLHKKFGVISSAFSLNRTSVVVSENHTDLILNVECGLVTLVSDLGNFH